MNLNSPHAENKMVQQNLLLFGVRKNICTAPFLDTQELHSWSTLKANVCIFLYISLISRYKILSDGMGGGWRLNNFLKTTRFLSLVKCFTLFHLIEIFGNLTIFQHFDTSIYSIKTLKFSRQFELQGKIVAQFFIRSCFPSI